MEEWREVPGTEGLYQIRIIGKEGECRSRNSRWKNDEEWHIIKNSRGRRNRIYWHLLYHGEKKTYQAARWIAITYPELVENEYFEGAVIDHIDADCTNNHPSNLRWVTYSQNNLNPITRDRIRKARLGKRATDETRKKMSKTRKGKKYSAEHKRKIGLGHAVSVVQYNRDNQVIREYESATEAYRQTGINQSHITQTCRNQRNTAGGYIWKYKTE